MLISVYLKLFKLIIVIIMFIKKKTKFIIFKSFKDLSAVTFTDFNKRKIFRALNNLNVNIKFILHDFKLSDFNMFTDFS